MNNEPVAWMYAVNGIWTAFSDELPPDDAYDEGTLTPLYTHQIKDLTEDEIKKCADSVCHAWKKNGVGELYMEDFARAILRKAQEK